MENLELLLNQANNGDAVSQYKLGRAYESGDGVAKNMVTARMWYQKSAENGYKNAEVKLRLLPAQEEATSNETAKASYQAPTAPSQIYQAPAAPKQTYQAPVAPRLATTAGTQNNNVANTQQTQTLPQAQAAAGQKSKAVAVLLALFLGGFGAHDFYLGYKKQGIIKIVLTLTILGSFITYFWTLIDFIRILCNGKLDSKGQLLK